MDHLRIERIGPMTICQCEGIVSRRIQNLPHPTPPSWGHFLSGIEYLEAV
jgi:hypothetical protein